MQMNITSTKFHYIENACSPYVSQSNIVSVANTTFQMGSFSLDDHIFISLKDVSLGTVLKHFDFNLFQVCILHVVRMNSYINFRWVSQVQK